MVEGLAASEDDGADGVVADHDGEARLFAQEHVEVLQQGSAAREDDALVDDVGGELRRRLLEREEHGLDDGVDRLGERFADLRAETIEVWRRWNQADDGSLRFPQEYLLSIVRF